MKIYKAGTKYFSTYQEAKIYREKYFSSARWVEIIDVEENTINLSEDIVVSVRWFKSKNGLYVRSCWCIGTVTEFLKTDSYLNVLSISRPFKDTAYINANMIFRNMGAARYRVKSEKFLNFLESEISKVPIGGDEIQIKI